jgi:HPt (histidine-containing phosphotransfer) domain-containing protein
VNTGQATSKPLIDLSALLKRVDNDRALMRELLGLFHEEYSQLITSLREAVHKNDTNLAQIAAHTLKGMLASLAADRAAAAAARIEDAARNGKAEQLPGGLQSLETELDALLPAVASLMNEND